MHLLTAAIKKIKTATAKGMDGRNKLTADAIRAHHVTHKNLLKSKQFSLALKEYNDGAVTMWLSKLFQTSTQRLAKLKVRELTRLNCLLHFSECPRVLELHKLNNLNSLTHLSHAMSKESACIIF